MPGVLVLRIEHIRQRHLPRIHIDLRLVATFSLHRTVPGFVDVSRVEYRIAPAVETCCSAN